LPILDSLFSDKKQLRNSDRYNAPLFGIKVLDFSEVLAGPYCSQLLGDLGAEVIKVEPPWGDSSRKFGPPFIGKNSAYYYSINRNKRSIAIDLSTLEGKQVAIQIASKCDVVLESFRPGVMKKLGLAYEQIKKANPSVIYCSISGYGQNGPLSGKPGYDISANAASGIMSVTGEENGGPVKPGVPIADIGSGLSAAVGICASLFAASKGIGGGGKMKGAYIDVSLYDTLVSWLTFQAAMYFATGKNPKRMGTAHPILVPYQAFESKDHRYFILGVGSDDMWQRTCEALNLKKFAKDERFLTNRSRVKHRKVLVEILSRSIRRKDAKQWIEILDKHGVPCELIRTVEEALKSEHTKARRLIIKLTGQDRRNIKSIASPIHFGIKGTNSYRRRNLAGPLLGNDTIDLLREFGFPRKKIDEFIKAKIILTRS
jgi:crotonobetainyl-CoA:carnitine CoA-transferase CaiB-like acyl-CoA transferase